MMPLVLISTLLHSYIAWRLLPALAHLPAAFAGTAAMLALSVLLMPLALLARRRAGRLADALAWAGMLCLGLFSSLLVLTVLRDALLLGAVAFDTLRPGTLAMPRWTAWSAAAVPAIGASVTLWGLINARRSAAVVLVDVPIHGLPDDLHGFRIAQISDVHVGPTIKRAYVRRIVETVNGLQVDMVAVTGDLVDGRVIELAEHVEPLAELRSRHGSYFVTGNHEYYSGVGAWIAEIRRLGMHVLLNTHVVLRHGDAGLVLAGVTDFSAQHPGHRSDPQAALAGAPPDAGVRVLLAHQPRSATAAAEAGFDLQLSGHTHGGQFLPWNFFVRLQQPFTAGLHRAGRLWVYTSRGTGYWGPPKRFGAPSEITLLRLVRAEHAAMRH